MLYLTDVEARQPGNPWSRTLFFLIEEPANKPQVIHKILSTTIGIIGLRGTPDGSCSMKYFVMGVSFMLVAWIGTFMLMVA
nr:membrane protein YpdK [Serratia sp. PAMC26656]